ncbi:bactofilin family protein [Magnetovibrio sp.]|uniref:bactofilin family protein n=1 Tax=Magnetovibrio sp. TaxID=2024836 RepID=UPI002F91E4E2
MFSKNKKNQQTNNNNHQPRAVPSIISADLKIIGDLSSTGEIQVDGEVSGDIRSKVLLVGEGASIKGEIRAETVRVHGHVNGQIKATFVNLAKTAHVVGDILHENLSIQEGAFLEGHITHMSDQQVRDAAIEAGRGDSKPGEDRVNLVVKPASSAQPAAKPQETPSQTTSTATSQVPKAVSGS